MSLLELTLWRRYPTLECLVIDPTRSGAVAEDILGLDYDGTMIHDGWSPYD